MQKILFITWLFILCCLTTHAATETSRDGEFVAFANKTVVDSNTGLMWSQSDNGQDISWLEAVLLAQDLSLASYNDWRLPSKEELAHLFTNKTNANGLRINPIFHVESIILYASETKTCKAAYGNLINASINWQSKSRPAFGRILFVREITK